MSNNAVPKNINEINEEYLNKVFFFRENWFLGILTVITIAYAFFLLPPKMRKPQGWESAALAGFIILVTALAFFILTDFRKPVWIKRAASICLVLILCYLFYCYSGAKWNLVKTRFFNGKALKGMGKFYWAGLSVSLQLTIASMGFAVLLGLVVGVLRSFHNPVFETILSVYVDVFRSIPLIALMIFIFYAFPFLGFNLGAFPSATLAIVLMYSAYIAEIFRSGIEATNKIQWEAAATLGLTKIQTMRLIVLPQAFRIIIPPLTNSLVGILKDTSVAYAVTLPELLTKAQQGMINKSNPTPLVFVSVIYFAILFPMTKLSGYLEKNSKKWAKQAKA